MSALENKSAPPAPEKYSTASKVQPPPAPSAESSDHSDGTPPPPAPAPPPAMLVPPVEEPDDDPGEWGEEEETQCTVIYDFQGNGLFPTSRVFISAILRWEEKEDPALGRSDV